MRNGVIKGSVIEPVLPLTRTLSYIFLKDPLNSVQ